MELDQFVATQRTHGRPIVGVQGCGFVGVAIAAAVACASDENKPRFGVIGIDSVPFKIGRILAGKSPIKSQDESLEAALTEGIKRGNLFATMTSAIYSEVDILLVCLPVDLDFQHNAAKLELLKKGIHDANEGLRPGALIIILSTVPPGTCERLVRPMLKEGIDLAHSYERVTPGPNYLNSVIAYERVYAGVTPRAAVRCKEFWSGVLADPDQLTEVSSTTASETAKLVENSFRAVTIAFVQEWARYCEAMGLDFIEIADAVRERPSHRNLLDPRLGVGGYCLTKDPLLAWSAPYSRPPGTEKTGSAGSFPFCEMAIKVNEWTPAVVTDWFIDHLGDVKSKKVHVLGYSYAPDVGDTRHSPSKALIARLIEAEAIVDWSDPFVDDVTGDGIPAGRVDPPATFVGYDAVFVAVGHSEYKHDEFWETRISEGLTIADASQVLRKRHAWFAARGINLVRVGSGKDLNK